jgi:hypothetical protein
MKEADRGSRMADGKHPGLARRGARPSAAAHSALSKFLPIRDPPSAIRFVLSCTLVFAVLTSSASTNLITGDGGRTGEPADMSKLNPVRVVYDSEGGMNEAYYPYDGRLWARWETDFPQGDDNLCRRLAQITRIHVNDRAFSRMLTAGDLGDFPMLYMSDVGYMVLTKQERIALRRYLLNGGFVWVDDFWGDAEWRQFAKVMADILPGREWQILSGDHPILRNVFELDALPQIPALPFASPVGGTSEPERAHKLPAGSMDEAQMRAWLDDDGRIMVLATHNTDVGDGWEREAYGEWYFETFSTKSYMVGVNVIVYAMMH